MSNSTLHHPIFSITNKNLTHTKDSFLKAVYSSYENFIIVDYLRIMKINKPVTSNEHKLTDSSVIISTTDLKGSITHANDEFVKISGFNIEELINKNHNIVRHPDMPPAAFQDLWDSMKADKPWLGIVKNRCKNGDYYWVKAFSTPMFNNGEKIGYQSVRVKPSSAEIKRAEQFYYAINNKKKRWIKPLGLMQKILAIIAISGAITAFGQIAMMFFNSQWYGTLSVVIAMLFSWLALLRLTKPIRNAANKAKEVIHNPIAQEIITGETDELGQILLALELQEAKRNTLRFRTAEAANHIEKSADETAAEFDTTMRGINSQRSEITQIAAAIGQMTSSLEKVAQQINGSAEATHNANGETRVINQEINNTKNIILSLENDMLEAVKVIERLEDNSQNIGAVLDVIQNIAEQTNLLALNAAIEAARAGEAGRGFAVVADEVRTLATRTADSTHEIESIIEKIKEATKEAASVMNLAKQRADNSFLHVEKSVEGIANIARSIQNIDDMSTRISSTIDQQNCLSQEINKSIVIISEGINNTVNSAEHTAETTSSFSLLAKELKSVLRQVS